MHEAGILSGSTNPSADNAQQATPKSMAVGPAPLAGAGKPYPCVLLDREVIELGKGTWRAVGNPFSDFFFGANG